MVFIRDNKNDKAVNEWMMSNDSSFWKVNGNLKYRVVVACQNVFFFFLTEVVSSFNCSHWIGHKTIDLPSDSKIRVCCH